jgi:hypothetical protein
MRVIAQVDSKKKPLRMPQERFSRGGRLLWYSRFRGRTSSNDPPNVEVIETFREVEDDVDAATPVDAQNAPTGVWKSRKEREIPTASTSIIFLFEEEERRTKRLKPTVHEIGSPPGASPGRRG